MKDVTIYFLFWYPCDINKFVKKTLAFRIKSTDMDLVDTRQRNVCIK